MLHQSALPALAWPPVRSRAASFPPQNLCRDLPLPAPVNRAKTLDEPRLLAPRNAGSHYSMLPVRRDRCARLRSSPPERIAHFSHNAARVLFAAPLWEYTSRACFPSPLLRARPDEAPEKEFECCSRSLARSPELPSGLPAEVILPVYDSPRGGAWSRWRSKLDRTRRAVRAKCAAALILAWRSAFAPSRCAARKVPRGARKSGGCCG